MLSNATSLTAVDEAFREEVKDDVPPPTSRDTNRPAQPVDTLATRSILVQSEDSEIEGDDYSDPSAALKMLLINLISKY